MTSFVQLGELVHNSNWVAKRHIQTVRRPEESNFPNLWEQSGLKTDLKESWCRQDVSRSYGVRFRTTVTTVVDHQV
jgi:hypothetical protein